MIHNPFTNFKFSVSMVVFFFLITAVFYNASFDIATKFTNGVATAYAPIKAQTTGSASMITDCEGFAYMLAEKYAQAANRTAGLTPEESIKIAQCERAQVWGKKLNIHNAFDLDGEYGVFTARGECTADFNRDGRVNVSDIQFIFENWGDSYTISDRMSDRFMRTDDVIFFVFNNWGQCNNA